MVTAISRFDGYKEQIIKAAGGAGEIGDICAVANVLVSRIRMDGGGPACTHIMAALTVAAAAYHPDANTSKNPNTQERTAKAQEEAKMLFDSMFATLTEAYNAEPIAKGSEGDVMIEGKLGSEWTGEERAARHVKEHLDNLENAMKDMILPCRMLAMISMDGGALGPLAAAMAADRKRVSSQLAEEASKPEGQPSEPPAEATPPEAPAPAEEPPAPASEEPTAST